MAKIRKCDRCGKCYDYKTSEHPGDIASLDACGHPQARYDLCDDCMKDFEERFMKQNKTKTTNDHCDQCKHKDSPVHAYPCDSCLHNHWSDIGPIEDHFEEIED